MISGLFAAFSTFTRGDVPRLRDRPAALLRLQLVVHVRGPGVHLAGAARCRGECGDAGVVRVGVVGGSAVTRTSSRS
jgi:hypothetical protein